MLDFSYNGTSLSAFGGRLLQPPSHTVAARSIERVKIFGQSGDEIIDNGSYDNVDFSLKIGFFPHLTQQTARQLAYAVIDWLAPLQNGYYRYRDSTNPGYFTDAVLLNLSEIRRELPLLLTTTLKFTRVPYWYRDGGQTAVTFTDQALIVNPEPYPAEPVVSLAYTGALSSFTAKLQINGKETAVTMGAAALANQILDGVCKQHYRLDNGARIYLSSALPADLDAGDNIVTVNNSQITCTITPNWRRL